MTAIRPCIISSGEVAPGALVAVVGPNGAGKSTLFRGIVGILKPLAGSDRARRPRRPRHRLSAAERGDRPQLSDLGVRFRRHRAVARTGLFGGIGRRAARQDRCSALAAVGLNGFENRPIGTLSGGQMQRMLFARVLLQDARVIVLDEPFNAIDAKTSADLLALVRRWHAEQRTVLAALHDMDLVRANFPETLLLAREPVAWGATARGADAGKSAGGAADVRSLRRQRRAPAPPTTCRRRRPDAHDLRRADRALHRIRIHAPRAGRRDRAGAGRRADRRVPDAAADESGRRRDGARDPAGRGDRLPAVGPQSVRDDRSAD